MKDLEIRGAGNLLGGEQSGHIADVGFDLYVRLVGEAVAEYRGDASVDEPEVKIELPVDAHLPHEYVPSERLRLEMYKRLAEVRAPEQIDEVKAELEDRYGAVPTPVANLLAVAGLRVKARRGRPHRRQRAGQLRPLRPGRPARLGAGSGSTGSTRSPSSSRQCIASWCRDRQPASSSGWRQRSTRPMRDATAPY